MFKALIFKKNKTQDNQTAFAGSEKKIIQCVYIHEPVLLYKLLLHTVDKLIAC